MQDLWLEKIQEPSQVERLLEAFATRSGLLPDGAFRVRDQQALPRKLRQQLPEDIAHVWISFSHSSGSWLFIGMIAVALSQERDAPVLWVNVYNDVGALIEVGAWTG